MAGVSCLSFVLNFYRWLRAFVFTNYFRGTTERHSIANNIAPGNTDYFSSLVLIKYAGSLLRVRHDTFSSLERFQLWPAYNIGFGAIRAEESASRLQFFVGLLLRADLFQNKVSFTLIISFLYHHFRAGRRASISRTAPSPCRWW